MAVGIEGITLTDNAHIYNTVDAEYQSADNENQTYYTQYC